MMSSPALKYNDKVFAFFYNRQMCFRLRQNFDPKILKIKKFKLLNPFKTKGPLKGWYVIAKAESGKWKTLTQKALEFTKQL